MRKWLKQQSRLMNPTQLIVKCYAEQETDCWIAICLDFNLAVQGDSFEEVKSKLEAMIAEYVYDALEGEDKAFAAQLLSRRAPLSAWLKYYFFKIKIALLSSADKVFDEVMPLRLA
jgi:predicted RNase H-like HicB family nuclease